NADRLLTLFETAVKSSSMDANDPNGLVKFKADAETRKLRESISGELKDADKAAFGGRSPANATTGMAAGGGSAPGGPAAGKPRDMPAEKKQLPDRRAGVKRDAKNGKDGKEELALDLLNDTTKLGAAFRADDRQLPAKMPTQLYRNVDVTMEWA